MTNPDAPKSPQDIIKDYLDKRAATDPQFATAYAKENKNLKECFQYIMGEARKRGTSVCMSDDEVFSLAVHYYDEDDIKIEPAPKASVSTSKPAAKVALTEEEKAEAREAAKKAYEAACMTEYAQKAEQRKKAEAKKLSEQKKLLQTEYPSLF